LQGLKDPNYFIATQGPKLNTLDDLWEMIWSQNTLIIVMLCKCKENGKVLCANYSTVLKIQKINKAKEHYRTCLDALGISNCCQNYSK